MKKLLLLSLLILTSIVVIADEEYAYKEILAPDELYSVAGGVPFIATKTRSCADILYKHDFTKLTRGDLVTQLSYKGYNPGESFTRHFVVWMSNTDIRDIRDQIGMTSTETMTKVFEGDCTIPAGGSAEECIALLTIPLEQTFEYGGSTLRVVIESSGEAVERDVCFEQYRYYWQCRYVTSDEKDGEWSQTKDSRLPLTTITVATPVVNLTGTVKNQENKPVPNATIQMRSADWPTPLVYTGKTNDEGFFTVRIEEGNKVYKATVSAPGCATYTESYGTKVRETSSIDFTLYDAVEYKAGRLATIIMPVTPDASVGKYFRLDRIENYKLIFEREFSPQANIPYIISPDKDFVVDLRPLDLSIEAGKTTIDELEFIGTYMNKDINITESQALQFIDEAPDAGYAEREGFLYPYSGRIAALHAYFVGRWNVPQIVYHDDTDGILPSTIETMCTITYDLQGRRLSKEPAHGVYIQNGRKRIK